MTFRSKIGWWYWATIVFVVVAMAYALIVTLNSASSGVELAVLTLSALVGIGLPVWLAFSTRYQVNDSDLVVRSGPFRWTIPRNSITTIRRSRSILSSPALSLDRLEIEYSGGEKLHISPDDQDGFLAAIGHTA